MEGILIDIIRTCAYIDNLFVAIVYQNVQVENKVVLPFNSYDSVVFVIAESFLRV